MTQISKVKTQKQCKKRGFHLQTRTNHCFISSFILIKCKFLFNVQQSILLLPFSKMALNSMRRKLCHKFCEFLSSNIFSIVCHFLCSLFCPHAAPIQTSRGPCYMQKSFDNKMWPGSRHSMAGPWISAMRDF